MDVDEIVTHSKNSNLSSSLSFLVWRFFLLWTWVSVFDPQTLVTLCTFPSASLHLSVKIKRHCCPARLCLWHGGISLFFLHIRSPTLPVSSDPYHFSKPVFLLFLVEDFPPFSCQAAIVLQWGIRPACSQSDLMDLAWNSVAAPGSWLFTAFMAVIKNECLKSWQLTSTQEEMTGSASLPVVVSFSPPLLVCATLL